MRNFSKVLLILLWGFILLYLFTLAVVKVLVYIVIIRNILLPHRQIKYPVDFDDELKTRKRQIR